MSADSPDAADCPRRRRAIETLIQRCLQGDQLAWDAIVRQYRRKVFNVAYKFVGKHDEAEDLTQDIFLKIFKSLDTFDRRANFQTWLISVSRNLCIDHYRSVRKERETIDRDVDTERAVAGVARPGPDRRSRAARPRRRCCGEALAALPETLRTAVLMRDIQELSYQEIADAAAAAGRHGQVADQPRTEPSWRARSGSCAASTTAPADVRRRVTHGSI